MEPSRLTTLAGIESWIRAFPATVGVLMIIGDPLRRKLIRLELRAHFL
jgi:hypothetical protein